MLSGWQRVAERLNVVVALLCVVVVLGMWLATLQRIDSERRQAIAAAREANLNLAIAFEQQVHRTLKSAEQVAYFVREQFLRHPDRVDLRRWLDEGLIRESMFTIISVVDENGDILDSTQQAGRVNYADRDFFTSQRDGQGDVLFINVPVVGRVSGAARIPISLPIRRDDGSFVGVVVLSVAPDDFIEIYRDAHLGGQGMLELIGLDGVVRSRRAGAYVDIGSAEGTLTHMDLARTEGSAGYIHEGHGLDGVRRIVASRVLEGYPLIVSVGTSHEAALVPMEQRKRYYLWVASGASVVALLLGFMLLLMLQRSRRAAEVLAKSEALYRATFDQAAIGIAHLTPKGCILGANQKLHHMLGYGENELSGVYLGDLRYSPPEEGDPAKREGGRQERFALASSQVERQYRRKDGSSLWVSESMGVVRAEEGDVEYLVIVMQDITARKELEARLAHAAMHDALTGLANRTLFHDRLAQALESARRHGHMVGLLYLDLNGFKEVNDSLGHAAGDALLRQVAKHLAAAVRAEDTVARFGGDEFAIVLPNIRSIDACERVAGKLASALAQPCLIDGRTVRVSASIGIALFPRDGENADTLVLRADESMYAAKRAAAAAAESLG